MNLSSLDSVPMRNFIVNTNRLEINKVEEEDEVNMSANTTLRETANIDKNSGICSN